MRTVLTLLAICIATLYCPIWVQLAIYGSALFLMRKHRLLLLLPAVMSDAYYAPTVGIGFDTAKMTLTVSVLLIIFWLVTTKTRVREWYGVEKA